MKESVRRVKALQTGGGVWRMGSVKAGDIGNVIREANPSLHTGDLFVVYWPTRYVTTIESPRDVEEVAAS